MIVLDVIGVPAPQGSKTVMPNGVAIEGSSKTGRAKHKSWRAAVTAAARSYIDEHGLPGPLNGPLTLHVEFRFPPTASEPHRLRHQVKPDLSKLLRSTEDALVDARIIHDDARVWRVQMTKRYARPTEPLGARIEIASDIDLEVAHVVAEKERARQLRAAARRAS
jgi:crossover junction endodeoxyribonuclease RusA